MQAALTIWVIAVLVVAAVATTPGRARVGAFLSALLLLLPAFVSASPVVLGLLTFLIVAVFAAALDFAIGRRPDTFLGRLACAPAFLLLIDAYHAAPIRRWFDRGAVTQIVASVIAGSIALYLWHLVMPLSAPLRYAARSLSAAVVVLALAEGLTGIVRLASAAAGGALRPVHEAPYLSRTVSEFWSRRWNPMFAAWLRRHCFSRFPSRKPVMALFATFALSAIFHAYLLLPIDGLSALSWAAFFLAQPVIVLAERRLHVKRWPPALARTWTMTALTLLIPLMVWPVLPLFHTSL